MKKERKIEMKGRKENENDRIRNTKNSEELEIFDCEDNSLGMCWSVNVWNKKKRSTEKKHSVYVRKRLENMKVCMNELWTEENKEYK